MTDGGQEETGAGNGHLGQSSLLHQLCTAGGLERDRGLAEGTRARIGTGAEGLELDKNSGLGLEQVEAPGRSRNGRQPRQHISWGTSRAFALRNLLCHRRART